MREMLGSYNMNCLIITAHNMPLRIINEAEIKELVANSAKKTSPDIPITYIKIDSLSITTMRIGESRSFSLLLNEGATGKNVVWTLANPSVGSVDNAGNVTLIKRVSIAGNVRLTATDPASGLSHSITLRIVL